MKTILRSRAFALVLLLVAVAMVGFGTIGVVQAAPRIQSADYRAEVALTDIHTALVESSKAGDSLDAFTVRRGDDALLTTMLADNGDTELKIGKKYVERLAARNTVTRDASVRKQSEPIPEYVRVSVRTYWKDANGKEVRLDPKYVKLEFVTDNGWTIDESASTAERTVLYYDKILQPGETSTEFVKSLTIDPSVNQAMSQLASGDASHSYEGMKFYIDARVDAVQDHNGAEAMTSAWGRTIEGY